MRKGTAAKEAKLNAETLRSIYSYDRDSGRFCRIKTGDPAGYVSTYGYCVIGVCGVQYLGHRLAWLYVHGVWPADQIDHINRDRADNRLSNLRQATNWQNCGNSRPRSGRALKGITKSASGRWQAQIKINYRNYYLGSFDTPEEANAAYAIRAEEAFGEFARARV